ncbi:molybdopterin-dependent oxidoreductase [Streptomyces sp. NPDC002490]|uniref:molybdopterin-dependent oxidoreductase n=1 Tax=Streptomyces sp. NPDC002490 TaxID=3154416 RepID=UPI00332A075D
MPSAPLASAASPVPGDRRTALRVCPLCEATCGLALTIEGTAVVRACGDREDVFSHGFICPEGALFGDVDGDPDRLARPLVRKGGRLVETGWPEAFDAVAAGLGPVVEEYGPDAVGVVLGNAGVHTVAGVLYPPLLVNGIGTRSLFTTATLDQMPRHVSSGLLFGDPHAIPVPDLDRTDHLLLLGADPVESHGSLCTAPDFPGRLEALRARGGTLTVVDPRRTRTARLADRHVPIRPGTDALLLAAMANVLFAEDLVRLRHLAPHVTQVPALGQALVEFTPEAVSPACDVPADTIRTLARELVAAPTAAVYGRIGSGTVLFGTLAGWLGDVLNVLTGNLDRPGGVLFPRSATDRPPRPVGPGRGFPLGRWRSRVSGHPEVKGELPLAALAEEIDTPGEGVPGGLGGGPLRALITSAANPVPSAPDGDRLDRALARLDFMVSVDPYLNETTRHAHVVLPPPRPSRSPHYDFAFNMLAVRNQARYSRPAVPLDEGAMAETEIHARLVLAATGRHGTDPAELDALVVRHALGQAVSDPAGPVHGRDPQALAEELDGLCGAERRLDLMLRLGPYGDGFGARAGGLTLRRLLDAPHGIDLGPLRPRLPQPLATRSGRIELLPAPIAADLTRLALARHDRPGGFVLVGRRPPGSGGDAPGRALHVHPEDARTLGLTARDRVRITGSGGEVTAPVEITDAVRPGVVSLPRGGTGTPLRITAANSEVSVNRLLDGSLLDPLSGTAVLDAVPVRLAVIRL